MKLIAAAAVMGVVHLSANDPATVVTIAMSDVWRSPFDAPTAAISADGRFVAFSSYASLAPADADIYRDIYVFDRMDGRVTLESVPPLGRASSVDSARPSISGSGRYLVYEMEGEIALRDRHEATTTIVGQGRDPVISADGLLVAFASSAIDIVPGVDANGTGSDVYLVGVGSGVARRVSIDTDGVQSPFGSSISPSVSADARYVAFASTAQLDAGAAARLGDSARRLVSRIYLHDARLGTTRQVDTRRSGRLPDADSWGPAMSANGRHVAFVSAATDLVAGDDNRGSDIFLVDLQLDSVELRQPQRFGSIWKWGEPRAGHFGRRSHSCVPIAGVRSRVFPLHQGVRGYQPALGRLSLRYAYTDNDAGEHRCSRRVDGAQHRSSARLIRQFRGVLVTASRRRDRQGERLRFIRKK